MTERPAGQRFLRSLAAWLITATLLVPAIGRAGDVGAWIDQDLVPWLSGQLSTHPRYKGEPVRVAVFRGAEEDPTPDLFSTNLASNLERELSRRQDIHLVQRPAGPDWDDQRLPTRLPCLPAAESYVVAVESRSAKDGMTSVQVRILDAHESEWVPGAVMEWHGRLAGNQQRALVQKGIRDDLRGRRDLPYAAGQEDLLAARAAHALGCALLAHPAENLALWSGDNVADEEASRIARLVPQYLARSGVIRVTGSRSEANMVLVVDFQPLDADMRQVWIALSPADDDPQLPSVRTSFYASPSRVAMASSATGTAVAPPVGDADLSFQLVRANCTEDYCREPGVLELRSPGSRHAELLAVARNGAVLRLYPTTCPVSATHDDAGVLRLPLSAHDREELLTAFAVVAGSARADDALQRELAAFPAICDAEIVRGAAARSRLQTLERRLASYDAEIRWRRINIMTPLDEPRLVRSGRN
jgi:hypothetical protein